MGYNTRRKSLSLTELGITLPKRSRTQSHPSPPSTIVEGEESERPSKKCRIMSPPEIKKEHEKKHPATLSPPPSPAAEGSSSNKVDIEGINDDIVIGTIQQLEATGNRPHLVKELAAILACNLHSVEKYAMPLLSQENCANILLRSANPCALISSRLTSYLHRPWPTVSPCPLAKDIAPVHPRRLYFFLTTMPRQPIPETVEYIPSQLRIISPSLSSASAADEEEERYTRTRHTLSPSPEVDLSSPELEQGHPPEPPTPGAPFSGRNSVTRERSTSGSNLAQGRRGGSPQLEHEERDFKQCANALYEQAQLQRRNSQASSKLAQSRQESPDVKMEVTDDVAEQVEAEVTMSIEEPESDEAAARKNSEVAAALFGQAEHLKPMEGGMDYLSSPLIQPKDEVILNAVPSKDAPRTEGLDAMVLDVHPTRSEVDAVTMADWETLLSPENVDVAELEDLFDAY